MNDVERVLVASVRECRLVLERLAQVAGLDAGLVPAVRDFVLDAEMAGAGALVAVDREPDLLVPVAGADPGSVAVDDAGEGQLRVDGFGQSTALAGPALFDLLVAAVLAASTATLTAVRIRNPGFCAGMTVGAHRYGVSVRVQVSGVDTVHLTGAAIPGGRPDPGSSPEVLAGPVLWQALQTGINVSHERWFRLWERANEALAHDSEQSRRHAGPTLILPDGTVVGEPLDEL